VCGEATTRRGIGGSDVRGYRGRFAWGSGIGSGTAREGLYVAANYNYLRGFQYENDTMAITLRTAANGLLIDASNIVLDHRHATDGRGFAIDAGVGAVIDRWEVGFGVSGLQFLNLLAAFLQFLCLGLRVRLRGSKSFQFLASGFQFASQLFATELLFGQGRLQFQQLLRIIRRIHFLLQRRLHRLDFSKGSLELSSPFGVFGHLLLDGFAPFRFLLQRHLELDQLVCHEVAAFQ